MPNWKRVSNFLPTLWLHAKGDDRTACEAARGNWAECLIQNYEAKVTTDERTGKSKTSHRYVLSVGAIGAGGRGGGPRITVMTEGGDGKLQSEDAPFIPHGTYSLIAPRDLHQKLAGFWGSPDHMGRPLRITYMGLENYELDGEKRKSHRFAVDMDADYVPQLVADAPAQLGGPNDEPMPVLDE